MAFLPPAPGSTDPSDPLVTMDDGTVMPRSQALAILASPRPGAPHGTLSPQPGDAYPDGAVPSDPNQPVPPGPSAMPPLPGATPTTAAAQATGFPGSQFALALQQRMAGGGPGPAMDFYNFVKSQGVMPAVDPNAQLAPPPIQQPRPLVISPTNTSPGQIIPQQAQQGQQGQPMPQQPAMPQQPNIPAPGQIPGGVPQNPQMPGFYGMGRGPAQR